VNVSIRKTVALLPIACSLLLAAQSACAENEASSSSASNHEIYAKAGILGAGAGYTYTINRYFAVRADYTGFKLEYNDGEAGDLKFDAEFKSNHLGLYGDYFPFAGNFRISAGVHSRTLEASVDGRHNGGEITIGKIKVNDLLTDADTATGSVKWDSMAPYLGIGWGHGNKGNRGLGFVADIGVSLGSPKTTLSVSNSLRQKLDNANAMAGNIYDVDQEIEDQRREVDDKIGKYSFWPHLYVGISYRF